PTLEQSRSGKDAELSAPRPGILVRLALGADISQQPRKQRAVNRLGALRRIIDPCTLFFLVRHAGILVVTINRMHCWLRRSIVAILGAACLASVIMWIRSYFAEDEHIWNRE